MSKPVQRRTQILEFLRSVDYSPSMREICDATGLKAHSTVAHHIERLERDGLIKRHGNDRRISVVKVTA